MTSHGGNEDVNEYTRSVLEWLSSDATHRKMFVDAVVAVFQKEELSPGPELADLASLDEHILVFLLEACGFVLPKTFKDKENSTARKRKSTMARTVMTILRAVNNMDFRIYEELGFENFRDQGLTTGAETFADTRRELSASSSTGDAMERSVPGIVPGGPGLLPGRH